MRAVIHHRGTRLLLAAVVLVAAIAAATAYATASVASRSATVIVACRNDTNGLLRVVTRAAQCRRHETALSWNVQGPPGPPGVALAFAHVLADGTIDAARSSQNIIAVTKGLVPGSGAPTVPGSGFTLYCFDLATTAKNISVTVEDSLVANNPPPVPGQTVGMRPPFVNATVDPSVAPHFGCAAGADAAVVVPLGSSGAPFYALFN